MRARIPLQVSYDHSAVRALNARIRAAVNRKPVNASVVPTSSGLRRVRAHEGVALNSTLMAAQVERALTEPTAPHSLDVPLRPVRPAVTNSQLTQKYASYIVVDRPSFKLRLYKHLKLSQTYTIAVGRQGLETPGGLHTILNKQVNPSWYVPKSSWAGSLAGQVIPPGPKDPLKARFMAIDDRGDGIHGTEETSSLGTAGSHGCIRMAIPDVIDLFGKVGVGTAVYII